MQKNNLRRRLAVLLWWIGLASLLVGVVSFFVYLPINRGILLGVGAVALGLNPLLGGDLIVGPPPRTYTARGQVVRGYARIKAG